MRIAAKTPPLYTTIYPYTYMCNRLGRIPLPPIKIFFSFYRTDLKYEKKKKKK